LPCNIVVCYGSLPYVVTTCCGPLPCTIVACYSLLFYNVAYCGSLPLPCVDDACYGPSTCAVVACYGASPLPCIVVVSSFHTFF